MHFAGLVGGAGDHRQAFGDAGVVCGGGADGADRRAAGHQFGQHLARDRQRLPFPVEGRRPAALLVVEGNIADLAADRIDEAAGEAVVEVAREQQVFVGARPDLGLVLGDPAGFGFVAEEVDGVAHADGAKGRVPPPGQLRLGVGTALVEPDDGRAQRLAVLVEIDHRRPLRGDDQAAYRSLWHLAGRPQLQAGPAQGAPEFLGIVFDPARLRRLVAVDHHLRLGHQIAAQIEEQRAHALGAVVDGQQVIVAHGFSPCMQVCQSGISASGGRL